MTPTQACMSEAELQQLGHDEFPPDELNRIEEHLSECGRCRELLDTAESAMPWCDEIRQVLTTSPEPLSSAAADDSTVHDHDAILRLLGPSEDPRMLGRIGCYEVTGVIGRGGMGIVFKAFDAALDRFVAIKMLLPHLAASGAARQRFSREGQAAAAVIDDHVLPIYSVDQWQGTPYLVMQYSRGTTLQKRIQDQGPLQLKEILRISLQTARGLAAAHAQGLVHRDVKPSNILLDGTVERALLTDFGLARAADDASVTRTGTVSGTPQYMSPEQVRGESIDSRSDLFSLGCTMYAMCTGRSPFRSNSTYAVMHHITSAAATPIREINPDIPDWLSAIISKLMSKQADDRYASAEEVAELLEDCLAHVQQPTAVPLPESCVLVDQSQPDRVSGRFASKPRAGARRLVPRPSIGVIAMFSVFCLGLLGTFLWQSASPPDISGRWAGEGWGQVELEEQQSGRYVGTYTDTFGDEAGKLQLKWSRVERRFNGSWQEGEDRFGKISVRLVDDEVRGAWTTNKNSGINPGTPRLADLLWTRAAKAQPGQTEFLVLGADGKPVADNAVIRGSQGYSPNLPRLSETPCHRGVISFEKLAAGTHWLLVRDNHTVWRITWPEEKNDVPPIYTSLPKYPSLIGKKVDVKVAVEIENRVEFIVIEIHNRSEEHLLVAEANLQLMTAIKGPEPDARVMSPLWSKVAAGKYIPETTIRPGQTLTVRLNWNDWVKHGYWFSRDGEVIAEPSFPELQPGTTWVRVTLGSAPPVMVTHPDKIVHAREAKGASLGIPDARKLTGTWRGEKDGMAVELTFNSENSRMLVSTGRFSIATDLRVSEFKHDAESIDLLHNLHHADGIPDGTPDWEKFGELQDGEGDALRVKFLPLNYPRWDKYMPVGDLVLERVPPVPLLPPSLRQKQAALRNQELQTARDAHAVETVLKLQPNEAAAKPEDEGVSLGIPDAKKLTGTWRGEKDGMAVELTFTTEKEWRMLVSTGRFTFKHDPLVWEFIYDPPSIDLLMTFQHLGGIRDAAPGWDKIGELQDGEGDTLRINLLPRGYEHWYKYRPVDGLVLERGEPAPRGVDEQTHIRKAIELRKTIESIMREVESYEEIIKHNPQHPDLGGITARMQTARRRLAIYRDELAAQVRLLELELADAESAAAVAAQSLEQLNRVNRRVPKTIPDDELAQAQREVERAQLRAGTAETLLTLYRQIELPNEQKPDNSELKPPTENTSPADVGATFPPEAKLTRNADGQIVAVRIAGSSDQKRLDMRSETLDAIAELEHLESLSLWGTTVNDNDIKKLANLKTLQMMDLTYTDVTGKSLSVLAELPKLIWLRLDGCDVDDQALAPLSKMPQLSELYLKQTRVTDAGLKHLAGLKNLILLDLSDCRVSDTGLASLGHLSKIRSLWLSKTIRYGDDDRSDLTDRCVDYLLTLNTLTDLRIADSKLTDSGLQRLRDGLPKANVNTERTGVTYPSDQRK